MGCWDLGLFVPLHFWPPKIICESEASSLQALGHRIHTCLHLYSPPLPLLLLVDPAACPPPLLSFLSFLLCGLSARWWLCFGCDYGGGGGSGFSTTMSSGKDLPEKETRELRWVGARGGEREAILGFHEEQCQATNTTRGFHHHRRLFSLSLSKLARGRGVLRRRMLPHESCRLGGVQEP